MSFMNGIKNFLLLLDENWTNILVCAGIAYGIVKKTQEFILNSREDQYKIIKTVISETMLKRITDAEVDYEEMEKAGSIKRAQVICQIYKEYPILSKIADQNQVINWLDNEIDNSLKTLREIIKENQININN